jgi:hypothetical protein
MKTFLEFVESQKRLPCIDTIFGSHAIQKSVQEAFIPEVKGARHLDHVQQIEPISKQAGDVIHSKNSPDAFHPEVNRAKSYTSESTLMNGFLKTHYKNPEEGVRPHHFNIEPHHLAEMDSFMEAHRTPEDMHLFTGVTKSPLDYHGPERTDKPFIGHLPHYTSTSTNYKEALSFASPREDVRKPENLANANQGAYPDEGKQQKHVLKISVPKGTHAVSLRPISQHPSEDEILLHRGHNLEIHPHPTFDPENNAFVWHAKIAGHNPETVYQ